MANSCAGPTLFVAAQQRSSVLVSKQLLMERPPIICKKISTGTEMVVFEPEGQFVWKPEYKKVVAIAAGSGITPIMSMLKTAGTHTEFQLFYGNKSQKEALFLSQIQALSNTQTHFFYSQENVAGAHHGRIDDAALKEQIKQDLNLLQADAFFLCGPQQLVE